MTKNFQINVHSSIKHFSPAMKIFSGLVFIFYKMNQSPLQFSIAFICQETGCINLKVTISHQLQCNFSQSKESVQSY